MNVRAIRRVEAEELLWATAAHSATGWLGGPRVMWTLTEALAALERSHTVELVPTITKGTYMLRLTSKDGISEIFLNLTPPPRSLW